MAKKAEVIITCDATTVKRVLEGLNREMDKTNQRRQQLQQKQAQGSRLNKAEEKELRELIKYENALAEKQQKVTREAKKMGEVMQDLASAKLKDLKKALREGKQALDNMSANSAGRVKLVNDLKKIQDQIEKNTGALSKNKDMWGSLGTTIKNLFAYAGIFAGFNMLKAKMTEAYEGNKRFSDSMANVRKVSGLAMEDIKKLADNLKGVDSRTGLGGLMELSYTGAKLGFGNYGIGGLESFAKSAVKVQNALAEDMGEDSMTALSKMVEVMGLIPKMGVERAMDATGSAIFKLASTSTATGTNIVEFSKRLMGLANIAHISTADLLAFGSAADSMALMPEVAATAFNKLITSVQKQPNLIENALKIPKGTISDLYQSGKMTEALVTIFEKMREKGGMNALMQSGVFKDLGSDGARLVAVMATMANRVDMLQQHLATSRVAFEEGTAVAQEYAIQMDTAAAYSERAANIWEKAFVNPEGVDNVKEFTKAWYQTTVAMTTNEKIMGQIKFTLTGILTLLKYIVYLLPSLFMGGAMWGVTRMLISLGNALKIATVATTGFAAAWKGMSLVTKTNWIGLAATAVFALIEVLGEFNKEVQMSSSYMKGFKKDLSDVNAEQYKAVRQLDGYRKAIDEAKEGTKQRQAAITNFNSKFGPYLSKLLTEKATAYDVAQAYQEVVKQMKAKIALQAKEKDIEKYVSPRVGWEANKPQTYHDSVKGTPGEKYNSTWLKGVVDDAHAAGKSVRQVADSIAGYMGLGKGQVDKIWQLRGYGPGNVPSGGGMGDYIRKNPKSMQAQLLNAINYTLQSYATSNAQKAVDDKYKPYEQAWDNQIKQETYEPLQDKPDKTTGGGGSGGPKVPPELAEAKKEAEKASKAVIGSIEEYYRLQEAAANELAANGQLKGEDFKMLVEHINNRKDKMLLEARRAIVGDPNEFEQIRQTLTDDLINRDDNVSLAAIKRIQEAEPAKQGEVLKKFDGSKAVYGLDSNAFLNNIRKNAAQNELNIQRRQEKVQEEIDKILTQYHFVEQAQRTFGDKLVRLGLASDGYAKVTQQLADGTKITANTKEVQALASKIVGMGGSLYSTDNNSAASLAELIKNVMTDKQGQREGFASIFPDLDRWLGDPEKYKTEMQLFYQMMIDMDDEYYAAMKKNYDRDKKLQNERWERSGTGKYFDEMNTELSLRSRSRAMTGQNQGENFAQMGGFTTLAEDPDIALYGAKLAASKLWLQQLEQEHADEKLIREAQAAEAEANMAYQEQIMEKINERITRLQAWTEPIEQFGTDTGQAMADAVANSESMAEGMEAALKKMALAWGQNSLKIIEALLMEKLKQKMIHKAIQTEEVSHQAQLGAIEQSGATAREVISQVSGATKLAGTMAADRAIEGEAIAHDTTMIAQDQSTATAENAINTSRAAGKTLADLGWWGIPLIAVIMALLNGLLQMALGSSSKESGSGASNTAKKAKLVSGMLTYDEGNVGSYVGTDGKIYRATATSAPDTGLVTQPIATTVQGNPALVAEKGPEIVIGRLATRRIMMDEPGLIRHLAQYDKNHAPMPYRTFDNGNVNGNWNENGNWDDNGNGNGNDNARLTAALEQNTIMMQAMMQQLKKPVHINMYGSDGLHTQLKQADKVMSRYDK